MKEAASFFKVLADEARLKMLWLLFHHRELCVCDFIEVLRITQSKASRHLRILYRAGLVTDRRAGLWIYYSLSPRQYGLAEGQLHELRSYLANQPGAAALLKKLSARLRRKGGDTRCAGQPISRPTPKTKAAAMKAALPGGARP